MNWQISTVSLVCAAAAASAQSVSIDLTLSDDTPAAGQLVTLTATATYSTGGASSGEFGTPGLFGFSGRTGVSDFGFGELGAYSIVDTTINPVLTRGPASYPATTSPTMRVNGGVPGFSNLTGGSDVLFSYTMLIDETAVLGSILTFDYTGVVVLATGDNLSIFSTSPAAWHAGEIVVTPVTLTIEGGGCTGADLAEPFGTLDIDDVLAFLGAFAAGDSAADLAIPFNELNIDDVLAFLGSFAGGCP